MKSIGRGIGGVPAVPPLGFPLSRYNGYRTHSTSIPEEIPAGRASPWGHLIVQPSFRRGTSGSGDSLRSGESPFSTLLHFSRGNKKAIRFLHGSLFSVLPRPPLQAGIGQRLEAAVIDHLIRAEEILNRGRHHMHELREREHDHDQEAKQDMDLVDQRGVEQVNPAIRLEDEETLSPVVNRHVGFKRALARHVGAKQPRKDLNEDQHDDRLIREAAADRDALVRETADHHQGDAGKRDDTSGAAHDDGEKPLRLVAHEPDVKGLRSEQTEDVAEEHADHGKVKERAPPLDHLVVRQKLSRKRLDRRVRVADTPDETRDEDAERDVRQVSEQDAVDPLGGG